jgi:hypothetical protein
MHYHTVNVSVTTLRAAKATVLRGNVDTSAGKVKESVGLTGQL